MNSWKITNRSFASLLERTASILAACLLFASAASASELDLLQGAWETGRVLSCGTRAKIALDFHGSQCVQSVWNSNGDLIYAISVQMSVTNLFSSKLLLASVPVEIQPANSIWRPRDLRETHYLFEEDRLVLIGGLAADDLGDPTVMAFKKTVSQEGLPFLLECGIGGTARR